MGDCISRDRIEDCLPCASRAGQSASDSDWQECQAWQGWQSWEDDWTDHSKLRLPVGFSAGVRFVVHRSAADYMHGPEWVGTWTCDTGPMRVRIVGDIVELGLTHNGYLDPQYGIDLFWEEDRWTSRVIQVEPGSTITYYVVRMDQPEMHPGELQQDHREQMHGSRNFVWSPWHQIEAPGIGQVVEVYVDGTHCEPICHESPPCTISERENVVSVSGRRLLGPLSHSGRQRCYTFDAPDGVVLHYSLYLPPGYKSATGSSWPMALYLHQMFGCLDGDNNLFFESDAPCKMLLGDERCPSSMREKLVILIPQCPTDFARPGEAVVWLRHGRYDTSTYAPQVERALKDLVESVVGTCNIDPQRVSVMGSSMGAYAALELVGRWPRFFSAATFLQAHYDLLPIDELVHCLTYQQSVPLWFIHAVNDSVCPHDAISELVRNLRLRSAAEVRFTSYIDSWSDRGHCADRVACWSRPEQPDQIALGEEVWNWLSCARAGHVDPDVCGGTD